MWPVSCTCNERVCLGPCSVLSCKQLKSSLLACEPCCQLLLIPFCGRETMQRYFDSGCVRVLCSYRNCWRQCCSFSRVSNLHSAWPPALHKLATEELCRARPDWMMSETMMDRHCLMDAVSFLQNGSDSYASVHESLMRHLGCEDPARRSMPSWWLRSHHGPYLRHPELARSFSGPKTAANSGSACRRTASTNTALRALETFRGQNGISMQSIWQQCIERKTSWTAAGCALRDRRMLFGSTDQDRAGNCRACSTQS